MTWSEILKVTYEKGSITLTLGPGLLIAFAVFGLIALAWWCMPALRAFFNHDVVEATLKIGGIGEVKVRPNYDTVRIAYQAWVEIETRKVGLLFDEDHDVIVEVYNSWYEVFGRLRDLAKSVPAHRLRKCEDTRKLVEIMMRVLNEGLRPHLTQWQARFRHWHQIEQGKSPDMCPQELQQNFPQYDALVSDLKSVNVGMIEYANWLREIAEGKSK